MFQIFLRVTIQNQICIRQWVIVDEVVQFCPLRYGHIQRILDSGAIEIAKDAGEFDNDFAFPRFPKGCCGDTSDLLAEYLAQHDIYTYYVCGQKGTQSHAWLVLVNTVTVTTDNSDADRKYKSLISVYNEDNDVMLLRKYYNLKDAIIIDITGDQFTNQKCFLYYNIPVYVGFLDDFHSNRWQQHRIVCRKYAVYG